MPPIAVIMPATFIAVVMTMSVIGTIAIAVMVRITPIGKRRGRDGRHGQKTQHTDGKLFHVTPPGAQQAYPQPGMTIVGLVGGV